MHFSKKQRKIYRRSFVQKKKKSFLLFFFFPFFEVCFLPSESVHLFVLEVEVSFLRFVPSIPYPFLSIHFYPTRSSYLIPFFCWSTLVWVFSTPSRQDVCQICKSFFSHERMTPSMCVILRITS
jgi:hypothetical protein